MVRMILLVLAAAAMIATAAEAPPIAAHQDRTVSDSLAAKLTTVRTVFVDELRGGDGREQIRDMIIGSVQRAGLFILTEDERNADAYLRGSAEDVLLQEIHRQRDGIQVRGSVSSSEREEGGASEFGSSNFGIGDTNETYRRDHKHEAMAAVRLVLKTGEVVWSTTQESTGAKYRGPSMDVAEKVARELAKAVQRARELTKNGDTKSNP